MNETNPRTSRKKKIVVTGLIVVLLIGIYAAYMLTIAGQFKDLKPHFNGTCRAVNGVPGPEDVQITADGTGAYITSLDRAAQLRGEQVRGGIFYYDLTLEKAEPVNVLPGTPAVFHPHGLSLFEDGDTKVLFVVNHPRGDLHGDIPGDGPAHTIEVYDINKAGVLTHRESVVDEELLYTPNDVAAVSATQFYATNDHGATGPLARKLENYLRLSLSNVVYYNGKEFIKQSETYGYANGIAVSLDGKYVYVASPTDRTMFVLRRNKKTGELTPHGEVFVETGLDNVNVDPGGAIWTGSHPQMLTLSKVLADATGTSPSQVLRIDMNADHNKGKYTEVFLSLGDDISASTSAARFKDRLLIGTVVGDHFMDCRMPSE